MRSCRYLLISVWFAMHASIAAQSWRTKLLTQEVRLALPTDEPFEGGKLKVWDGRPTVLHEYAMAPGDCIFLDARVWHQGCAITSGARYALVLFLRLRK